MGADNPIYIWGSGPLVSATTELWSIHGPPAVQNPGCIQPLLWTQGPVTLICSHSPRLSGKAVRVVSDGVLVFKRNAEGKWVQVNGSVAQVDRRPCHLGHLFFPCAGRCKCGVPARYKTCVCPCLLQGVLMPLVSVVFWCLASLAASSSVEPASTSTASCLAAIAFPSWSSATQDKTVWQHEDLSCVLDGLGPGLGGGNTPPRSSRTLVASPISTLLRRRGC